MRIMFAIRHLSKNRKLFYAGGLLVVLSIGIFIFVSGNGNGIETTIVSRGTLVEEVSVTGKVKPETDVELAFERSGKISRVLVSVGARVYPGQTLVVQENGDFVADLAEAEARLLAEEAELAELKRGARPEELDITRAELEKAEKDLDNYLADIPSLLLDAYQTAESSVGSKTDAFFDNDQSASPQLTFIVANQLAEFETESQRVLAGNAVSSLKTLAVSFSGGASGEVMLEKGRENLLIISRFLARSSDALNSAVGLANATLATYKADLDTARANVNAGITDLDTQIQAIAAQRITVQKSKTELALDLAGGSPEERTMQEAAVAQARAGVERAQAQLAKTSLRAPVAGVVTRQDAEVGEIVSANANVVHIISDNAYEIESFIPEADIVDVALGNLARVTLDALGEEEVFNGTVSVIEPAETVIEGISTYKVTLIFSDATGRAKSGMTANVDIETARKEDALLVPLRALVFGEGKEFVRVVGENKKQEKRKVMTGVRDTLGNVEILEGLSEGETVVTFFPGE